MRGYVIGLLSVVLLTSGCASGKQPAPAAAPPTKTAESHRQRTVQVADRVLDELRIPPGARRVSSGRPYGLATALDEPVSDNLVDVGRVWVGAGGLASLRRSITAHLPAGAQRSGTMGGPGSSNPATGISYDLDRRWQDPSSYSNMTLELSFVEHRGHAVARADMQAIYLPARTAAQSLPPTIAGIAITIRTTTYGSRVTSRTVQRRVGAVIARRLATDLNLLHPSAPGVVDCPALRHRTVSTLRFTGPGARTATEDDDGCGNGVTIGRGPVLAAAAPFTTDLAAALR